LLVQINKDMKLHGETIKITDSVTLFYKT